MSEIIYLVTDVQGRQSKQITQYVRGVRQNNQTTQYASAIIRPGRILQANHARTNTWVFIGAPPYATTTLTPV
jgi:hypothetical protein